MKKINYTNKELEEVFISYNIPIEKWFICQSNSKHIGDIYIVVKSVLGQEQLMGQSSGNDDYNFDRQFVEYLKVRGSKVFQDYKEMESYIEQKIK